MEHSDVDFVPLSKIAPMQSEYEGARCEERGWGSFSCYLNGSPCYLSHSRKKHLINEKCTIFWRHWLERVQKQSFPLRAWWLRCGHEQWMFYGKIGVLWLSAEVLTISFFPRVNLLSDTKISLLYPAVPDLIFRSMSLGSLYMPSSTL